MIQQPVRTVNTGGHVSRHSEEYVAPLPDGQHGFRGCSYSAQERAIIGSSSVNAGFRRTPRPQRPPTTPPVDLAIRYPGTISTIEYAARHGVTPVTVRNWIYTGRVVANWVPGVYRWVYRIPVEGDEAA